MTDGDDTAMRGVFIVGTGRSGTHFVTRLLNGFANAHDPLLGKEDPVLLKDIAKAAIHHRLPSDKAEATYRQRLADAPGILLDQHHPNLFFVSHWASRLDGIVFLYPRRPVAQIVASMLRHKGVMSWYDYAGNWRRRTIDRLPYPNRFLGLDSFGDIARLPPHLLCAHRVLAHHAAFEATVAGLNGALRPVRYVNLVEDPLAEFSRVFSAGEMDSLGKFTLVERPNPESLGKFRDVLTAAQVGEIEALESLSGAAAQSPG